MSYPALCAARRALTQAVVALTPMQRMRYQMVEKTLFKNTLHRWQFGVGAPRRETLTRETYTQEAQAQIEDLMNCQVAIIDAKCQVSTPHDYFHVERIIRQVPLPIGHVSLSPYKTWLSTASSHYFGQLFWRYKFKPILIRCGYRQHNIIKSCTLQTLNTKSEGASILNGFLTDGKIDGKKGLHLHVPYNWFSVVEARGLAVISSMPVVDANVTSTSYGDLYGKARVLTKYGHNSLQIVMKSFHKLACGCASFGADTYKAYDYAQARHRTGCVKNVAQPIVKLPEILL